MMTGVLKMELRTMVGGSSFSLGNSKMTVAPYIKLNKRSYWWAKNKTNDVGKTQQGLQNNQIKCANDNPLALR